MKLEKPSPRPRPMVGVLQDKATRDATLSEHRLWLRARGDRSAMRCASSPARTAPHPREGVNLGDVLAASRIPNMLSENHSVIGVHTSGVLRDMLFEAA